MWTDPYGLEDEEAELSEGWALDEEEMLMNLGK